MSLLIKPKYMSVNRQVFDPQVGSRMHDLPVVSIVVLLGFPYRTLEVSNWLSQKRNTMETVGSACGS